MKKVAVILLLFFMVCACKKYPDGPDFSLRSKLQRVKGTWRLDKYLVNGIDSTDYYNNYFGSPAKFIFQSQPVNSEQVAYYLFSITWGNQSSQSNANRMDYNGIYSIDISVLHFGNREVYNHSKIVSPITDSNYEDYNILKLYYRQMWLSAKDYGNTYEYHLTNLDKTE